MHSSFMPWCSIVQRCRRPFPVLLSAPFFNRLTRPMRMQRAGSPGRARAALTALEHLLACARPAALGASPYERYPALLPSLLALLASEQYAAHP